MHADTVLARAAAPVRLAAAGLIVALCTLPAAANDVLKWNETTVKAVTTGGQNPIQQSRTVAMVQGAVHDALNAIKPRYTAYYYEATAAAGAVPEAAVAAASHTVLVAVIPSFGQPPQRTDALAMVEEAYRAALAGIPDSPAKANGIAVGQAAGRRCWRCARTMAPPHAPYTPGTAPASGGRTRTPIRRIRLSRIRKPAPGYGRFGLAWLGQRHAFYAALGLAVLAHPVRRR